MATGNQAMGHKGMVIRLWKNDIKLVHELNIRVTRGTSSHREISATAESTKKHVGVPLFLLRDAVHDRDQDKGNAPARRRPRTHSLTDYGKDGVIFLMVKGLPTKDRQKSQEKDLDYS